MKVALFILSAFIGLAFAGQVLHPDCNNKHNQQSGGPVDKTCHNALFKKRDHCAYLTTTDCVCKDGFVRSNGACITPDHCPESEKFKLACGDNEEIDDTGLRADDSCSSPALVVGNCDPPKCFCKSGFVRHNGLCIGRSDCP